MLVLLSEADCLIARPVRPWDRIMVCLRARQLDRDLADGVSPDASVALAVRAQMLVQMPARRDLARGAQRVLAAATQASGVRLRVPVCRDRVAAAQAELRDLICGLLGTSPVSAQGVARASVLLGEASGPLYHRASRDDLRARVQAAVSALSTPGAW
jgi:hypothetical protein